MSIYRTCLNVQKCKRWELIPVNTIQISLTFLYNFNRTMNTITCAVLTKKTGGMWPVVRMVSRWEHFCEIVQGQGSSLTFHNQHLTCYVPFHCYFQRTPWPPSRAAGSWLTCSRGRQILADRWEGGDSQQPYRDTKHWRQSHCLAHMVKPPLDKGERRRQTFLTFLAMPVDTLSVYKPHIILLVLAFSL